MACCLHGILCLNDLVIGIRCGAQAEPPAGGKKCRQDVREEVKDAGGTSRLSKERWGRRRPRECSSHLPHVALKAAGSRVLTLFYSAPRAPC